MATIRLNHEAISKIKLPFEIRLSFKMFFEHWEEVASSKSPGEAAYGKEVLKKLEAAPELRAYIEDYSLLDKYEDEIKLLLSHIFPERLQLNEIKAAGIPFTNVLFNLTKRYQNILGNAGKGFRMHFNKMTADEVYRTSCQYILAAHYGVTSQYTNPFYTAIPDLTTGYDRYYRVFFNADFSSMRLKNKAFILTEAQQKQLVDNVEDIALWKKLIPPGTFEFEGMGIALLFDVTIDQLLSELKTILLEKKALIELSRIQRIQSILSQMLNIPDLKFGFTFIDEKSHTIKSLGHLYNNSLILNGMKEMKMDGNMCSYSQGAIFQSEEPRTIADVNKEYNDSNPYLKKLLNQGINSYIAVPVRANNQTIGLLEIGAPKARQLTSIAAERLKDILPMFTVALKRNKDEFYTRLEAVIQKKFTAIHPSVAWRFQEAADNILNHRSKQDQLESIVFDEVYPLFGQADIKDSSKLRNKAISADLIEQLNYASDIIQMAVTKQFLPILDSIHLQIQDSIHNIKQGLKAGDESGILDFLKQEVYPVFNHIKTLDPEIREAVEDYASKIDPDLGMIYKQRKDYEESVSLINEKIADYLEHQQQIAQNMFPHYFEKYQTDGVEHHIYIGQSMVNHKNFDRMYLQNLRLWQLISMIGIEQLIHQLKPKMKVRMDVASLLLIHSSPLAIRFRMDEKQFDVDGTYNIRYAIIKKRIDKAYIKNTNERLTIPGKIAMVYSQDKDAYEYRNYLKYLHKIGKIEAKIEDVELEELQGASGLRALRATVIYQDREVPTEELVVGSNGEIKAKKKKGK